MRKLFGFGSKLANKLTATKFVFSFTIHNLSPWPHGQRAIAIGWQRGKDKRGATRSVYPSNAPGRIGWVPRPLALCLGSAVLHTVHAHPFLAAQDRRALQRAL